MLNLSTNAKIEIVAKFLKTDGTTKAGFSRDNGISPRSLGRYIERYADDARRLNAINGSTNVSRIIDTTIASKGLNTRADDLLSRINKRITAFGGEPLNKMGFYCEVVRRRRESIAA